MITSQPNYPIIFFKDNWDLFLAGYGFELNIFFFHKAYFQDWVTEKREVEGKGEGGV